MAVVVNNNKRSKNFDEGPRCPPLVIPAAGESILKPRKRSYKDKEQTTECVYKVPCASCEKTYIGETGRKLGVRLQEHRSEVESKTNRAITRSHRSISSAESNRSELTDDAVQKNHVISWSAASVIDKESDRSTRWIKEADHIRKDGPQSMKRDEGSYQLSHAYDRFLGLTLTNRAKNRKKKT